MLKHARMLKFSMILAALALLGGCYGTFPLTRTVYRGNGNVYTSVPGDSTQRKIVQSVVMWIFIPVYAGASVADAVVFNTIEFWTGHRTSVTASSQKVDGATIALQPSADGREAMLTITRDGAVVAREHLVKVSGEKVEIRSPEGNLKGTMTRTADGTFEFKDAMGNLVAAK